MPRHLHQLVLVVVAEFVRLGGDYRRYTVRDGDIRTLKFPTGKKVVVTLTLEDE